MITEDLMLTPDTITRQRGRRHTGAQRAQVRRSLAELYARGMTVRQIAERTEMGYGKVYALLVEAQVVMRGNGYRSVKARALPRTEPAR